MGSMHPGPSLLYNFYSVSLKLGFCATVDIGLCHLRDGDVAQRCSPSSLGKHVGCPQNTVKSQRRGKPGVRPTEQRKRALQEEPVAWWELGHSYFPGSRNCLYFVPSRKKQRVFSALVSLQRWCGAKGVCSQGSNPVVG